MLASVLPFRVIRRGKIFYTEVTVYEYDFHEITQPDVHLGVGD